MIKLITNNTCEYSIIINLPKKRKNTTQSNRKLNSEYSREKSSSGKS